MTRISPGNYMEKVISVEHLHKQLKKIYFHGSEGEFYMEFTAATAETAKYIRSSFNAFMVHAPGNMNFDVDDTQSEKIKTGELGIGAVRVSGNLDMALKFLLSRRLINEEIHKLIIEDKDLTSFLQQSSHYKINYEWDAVGETKQDEVVNDNLTAASKEDSQGSVVKKNINSATVIPNDSSVNSANQISPRATKVK